MGRRNHCLECLNCAEGPGPDGEPCFQCERTERLLSVARVWGRACEDFVPIVFEPQTVARVPRSER